MRCAVAVVVGVTSLFACGGGAKPPVAAPPAPPIGGAVTRSAAVPFRDDLAFLERHGPVLVLEAPSGGRVALSAKYQGRVMTSAVSPEGASLGWVNRRFVEEGKTGTAFDNYGGEDRFWLGPEAGRFGLYFAPGAPFAFDAWQTPHELQEGAWDVASKDGTHVTFTRTMHVTNWVGTRFAVDVRRTVRTLDADAAKAALGAPVPEGVAWVGFASENEVKNAGDAPWTKATGLLSVWILAMYAPSADARAVLPFEGEVGEGGKASLVNDRYFGVVPADRLRVDAARRVLVFTCDGNKRSKIGLAPSRARPVLGSYSRGQRLLTIVAYDKPEAPAGYVNSMWEDQKDPFGGDVVNSYNDGPVAPGKPALGGFYELETSSPALALAPGASAAHTHRTFHFVGEEAALAPIAARVLGVSLADL